MQRKRKEVWESCLSVGDNIDMQCAVVEVSAQKQGLGWELF